MRKRCSHLISMLLIVSFFGKLTAQTFQVQLAAFTQEIDQSFFEFADYPTVYAEKDHNNFTRYTLGEFFTKTEAENARDEAIAQGFLNAHIISLDRPQYAYVGDSHELPLMMIPEKEQLYIRSVQFAAEDLSLNQSLLNSLEEALLILKNNPDLKLRIVGHTDHIGEPANNHAISSQRARIIQNFLLANEIPAFRLKMQVSEKSSPEVYFKREGLPKNRDFNRRIILTLVDLKEEIVVDNFQQQPVLEEETVLSATESMLDLMRFVTIT